MDTTTKNYDAWIGRDAYDRNGDKVGEIAAIYYDDQTSRPEWVAVRTGLFGLKSTFAPISGSSARGDDVQLAFDKDTIKDAPNCEDDGHLSEEEERRLFAHYQFDFDSSTGYAEGNRADEGFELRTQDRADTRGGDDAMTRSEEELHVGTERQATGTVRLRKYVVTENEQVTVPVSREEVRLEREPITDANIDSATSGPEITESEHEVVTYEERPVVAKETVPKERVRLEKDTVTEEKTISEEVRKEQIEVEGDDKAKGRTR